MTNYWLWLFLLAGPAIVFSVKPEAPLWQRSLRLVIAGIVCYVLMVQTWLWHLDRVSEAYEECLGWFGSKENHVEACGDNGRARYMAFPMAMFFTPMYLGYCEIAWIIRYRKRITKLGAISLLTLLVCFLITAPTVYGIIWEVLLW